MSDNKQVKTYQLGDSGLAFTEAQLRDLVTAADSPGWHIMLAVVREMRNTAIAAMANASAVTEIYRAQGIFFVAEQLDKLAYSAKEILAGEKPVDA